VGGSQGRAAAAEAVVLVVLPPPCPAAKALPPEATVAATEPAAHSTARILRALARMVLLFLE
jgi:hypothetical protein